MLTEDEQGLIDDTVAALFEGDSDDFFTKSLIVDLFLRAVPPEGELDDFFKDLFSSFVEFFDRYSSEEELEEALQDIFTQSAFIEIFEEMITKLNSENLPAFLPLEIAQVFQEFFALKIEELRMI